MERTEATGVGCTIALTTIDCSAQSKMHLITIPAGS